MRIAGPDILSMYLGANLHVVRDGAQLALIPTGGLDRTETVLICRQSRQEARPVALTPDAHQRQ